MNDLIPIILIALICLGIGFALGSLVTGLRSGALTKGTEESRPQEAGRYPAEADKPAQPSAQPSPPSSTAASHSSTQPEPAPPFYRQPSNAPAPQRPSLNPVGLLSRAIQSDVQSERASSKSIAAQIDEILQEKLARQKLAGQAMEKRAIRLLELPGKGMVVAVGLEQYDGVGAVPDPEIRSLIREAVADWERQASMGEAK